MTNNHLANLPSAEITAYVLKLPKAKQATYTHIIAAWAKRYSVIQHTNYTKNLLKYSAIRE
ncbi:hypothetical protein [Pseudoalteromonas aurantia]|uniref:Uncharacterized protein n=1 Tax=Pseudoalteromonas aurantia TaxID=43654 RepID=A0A5S3VC96_9GAMM|nr:hypothetical protein [Pseudoalteromonas aurantia]TMO61767.1 hypothetical protein CWC18_11185 [Pseudoalteromonas aurantia]TMO69160.1 hypothetical protein CWC19_06195 [Pseudoalteromonas aurantia]